ncbi:MAG: hypothetical protein ACKOWC_08315, partial [Limnohabitans sp.]
MSLTTCLKKAGSAISEADKAAIIERARELRGEGMKPTAAASKAVAELLAAAEAEVSRLSESVNPKDADDRDHFTLTRGTKDNTLETVTFARGEYVRATLVGSNNKSDHGEIDGISHARREFSVNGLWHPFGAAYKAERPEPVPKQGAEPLSKTIDRINAKHSEGLTAADAVSPLDAAKAVMREVYDGKASVETYQAGYRRVRDDEAGTRAELNKLTKDQLTRQFGILRDGTKGELVDIAYGSLLRGFALGKEYGPNSYIMSGGGLAAHEAKKREALDALVAGQTAEDLAAYAAEVAKQREAYAARVDAARKAVENPKTLEDFRRFMSYHTRDGKTTTEVRRTMLTPEQRAEFDRLLSTEARGGRRATAEVQKTRVAVAGQKVDGDIIATKHTRKGHDIFVVRLAERVSTDDYKTLLAGAKRIGGYYSSFKGAGAVPGFQFTTREQAEAFRALANGDNAAAVEAAKERRDAFEDDR